MSQRYSHNLQINTPNIKYNPIFSNLDMAGWSIRIYHRWKMQTYQKIGIFKIDQTIGIRISPFSTDYFVIVKENQQEFQLAGWPFP